ncbi:MAG TPA: HipA domain-containing protein, partial [Solirubrobacteraceae bacterium]|nr:HipA domain-containing protein [Solirubrobacteraceae bacterium]
YAQDPREQLDRLLATATFTVLIGNADAHGKNIALLHPTAEHIELAPLYDTVPTVLWPKLRRQGAMSVGGRYELDAITIADLIDEARSWRHDPKRARLVVTETAAAVLEAARELDTDSAVAGHVIERSGQLLTSAADGVRRVFAR